MTNSAQIKAIRSRLHEIRIRLNYGAVEFHDEYESLKSEAAALASKLRELTA